MTLEEAHKLLDEEYAKNETISIGFRTGKIPNAVRVTAALISVTERAKRESPFFSMPLIQGLHADIISLDEFVMPQKSEDNE